ncbi:MAG TPA: class I SAM-dependent methyltransferase [Tenuifilaceae bacterium]|nr:class I SAM-dependent methyltransferase [Tenuifilaceae bacterium]
MIQLLTPESWPDYELIDSGDGEKLERIGSQMVARPEPQALWRKQLSNEEWVKLADAYFVKSKKTKPTENEWGEWRLKSGAKEQWVVSYNQSGLAFRLRLGLTSFKHVGIFPEQAVSWNYIYNTIKQLDLVETKVLNLFAYTGASSLAARAAEAKVTHVDSVKQVVSWANENMLLSGMDNIRWIVDDALKFVSREVRRGNLYNGIILDPPAYGRGPDGEKWTVEENLYQLLELCKQVMEPKNNFLVLNLYSMGFSPLIAENLIRDIFGVPSYEVGELFVSDRAGRKLPLGIFVRFRSGSNF